MKRRVGIDRLAYARVEANSRDTVCGKVDGAGGVGEWIGAAEPFRAI
jgi:hypothetical protein